MRKGRAFYLSILFIVFTFVAVLAGCGTKSEQSVTKKIEKQFTGMERYKAQAEMTMKTGKEERTYDIDIWYEKGEEDLYRVDLRNETDDHAQTILKNKEGVFVLTPGTDKSFKFQSDWPEKNGQPYLYQSLIQDILTDNEAVFSDDENFYMYKTKTNYMNHSHLPYQQVYIDKKTYLPKFVQVLGEDEEPLVEVKFTEMNTNPSFSVEDFEQESILGARKHDGEQEEDDEAEETVASQEATKSELLLPVVTKGASLTETEEVDRENGTRTIMTFKGERNFTLIQEEDELVPASSQATPEVAGELVHLGHSVGAITDELVTWNYKGKQFYLASKELTIDELIDVASSVYGKEVK